MSVEDFLSNLGMKQEPEAKQGGLSWTDILSPSKVAVILGNKGSGKSALAYFLLEYLSRAYGLLPVVVNLPPEKRSLIPENWIIKSLSEIQHTENACVLIDEATTRIPAGSALENMIKGFSSLARQRSQIIIFIFHASSDVGSRILRGIDVVILKEPSKRQIEFGSKDNWMRALLEEAKARFRSIRNSGGDPREFCYIDCEEPEFSGMARNPLSTFWSDDLSKAWAGVDTIGGELQLDMGIVTRKGNTLEVSDKLKGVIPKQEFSTDDRLRTTLRVRERRGTVSKQNEVRKTILDWATAHNWVINPSKGMEHYVEDIFRFGYCPCDKSRQCPCPQSEIEVERDGYCLCRLYWKDLNSFRNTLKGGG